jgi:hypothetical protein
VPTPDAATPPVDTASAPAPIDPASYDFKLPDDFTVNEDAMTIFRREAAEARMTPDQAQRLLDAHITAGRAGAEALLAAQQQQFTQTLEKWRGEYQSWPEFQGERRTQTETLIGRIMDEYGSPAAREAFATTGAGDNPAVLRMFLNMASRLAEASPTPQGNPPAQRAQRKSLGEVFYPQQAS